MRAALNATLLLALFSGCSVTLDSDKAQCREDADCSRLNDAFPLTCEAGLCVVKQGLECLKSSACGNDGEICNVETMTCETSSTCNQDADCARYDGLSGYICMGTSCEPPECTKASDCESGSKCEAGRCLDPIWGCVGDPDNRPSVSGMATYKLTILSFLSRTPVPGLVVRTCVAATADPACNLGPGPGKASYDQTTGLLTVTDLPPRTPLRLRIEPPEDSGLFPVDYYSMLTAVGETMEVGESLLVPKALIGNLNNAFASQGVKVAQEADGSLSLGTLIARVYNCELKPASGAKITYESQSADTLTYYLDETLATPHTDWPASNEAGVGGVINLKINQPSEITIRTPDGETFSFSTLFQPKVLTSINFYPRNYSQAP